MNANKALWEKGDFTRLAAAMRDSGDALVETLGITPGMRVLDLGCGDGTTALPEAMRGAEVLGVDIASNLVAAGNARAKAAGLDNLRFEQGDASDLANIHDNQFDKVVSMFGAMFAPRPDCVAKEMVRVTRPGGTITMGNWIPGDPTLVAQVLRISGAYSPAPPAGFISPMMWGVEDNVVARFGGAGIGRERIDCARESYRFEFAMPPGAVVDLFRHYYGPTMNAFAAAEADGRADQLKAELDTLFESQNSSDDPQRTAIAATFLKVTVKKPD